MRPDLAEVQHWLHAEVVSDGQLASYLSVLRDDPNWCFTDTGSDFMRTLRLLYYPDGEPFEVVFDRVKGDWHPRGSKDQLDASL